MEDWKDTLLKAFERWNEFLLIPIALILYKIHVWLLPLYDPTAAPPDAGIFSFGLALLVILLFVKGIVWLLIKISWPGFYHYLDTKLEKDLWLIDDPSYRVLYALLFYFGILFAAVLLFKTGF